MRTGEGTAGARHPHRDGIAAAGVAALAVAVSWVGYGDTGLNLADEGFLWYGATWTAAGEVPLRDFQSYEPGRYYWIALWSPLLGDGLLGMRRAIALFEVVGLLAGLLVAARALGAPRIHVCLDADHVAGERALASAIAAAAGARRVGDDAFGQAAPVEVAVARPPALTPCGGGTALLEVLEQRTPRPRPRPPHPGARGLGGRPTWIATAETCAQLGLIIARGPDWLRGQGEAGATGTAIFQVSGAVARPGLYELPLGTRLGALLFEHAGGVARGRKTAAVLPDGLSSAALTPGQLDVSLHASALRAWGSAVGRGHVVVIDDQTCMVAAAGAIGAHFRSTACGHDVYCREGTAWIHSLLERIADGAGGPAELAWLLALCDEVGSDTHCGAGDRVGRPVRSLVGLFRDDFESHLHGTGCGRDRAIALP